MTLGDTRVSVGKVMIIIAREPRIDGAGGDETDAEGDGGSDADVETAGCAHWIRGVEDAPKACKMSRVLREGAVDGRAALLVVWVEDASHAWPWSVAVEERIGSLPGIAVRGADGTHLVAIQHHGSVRNVDDEGV